MSAALLCADYLIAFGLVLDIVGVGLLYRYGLPSDVHPHGGTIILWAGGKTDAEAQAEYRHYKRWSRIGLGFILAGFIVMLIGNFVG